MSVEYLKNESFELRNGEPIRNEHAPKILILYGSLRPASKSKMLAEEAGRILKNMGADIQFFDPAGPWKSQCDSPIWFGTMPAF